MVRIGRYGLASCARNVQVGSGQPARRAASLLAGVPKRCFIKDRKVKVKSTTRKKKDYLSKQDIAEYLKVDRRSVQNWIEAGQLPAIDCRTVGASRPLYRVAWADFLAFCRARRVSVRQLLREDQDDE